MAEINYAFGDYRTNVVLDQLNTAVTAPTITIGGVSGLTAALAAKADSSTVVTPKTLYTFSKGGALTVAAGTQRFYNDTGRTLTITSVRASVGTAPTGAALLVDVNKNGTTLFTTQSNRPSVAISGNTATAAAVQVTSWAAGEYLTVDVDQIGSTVAGSDLVVTVVAQG